MFSSNGYVLLRCLMSKAKFVRYKHKENHWSVQRKRKQSTQLALEHFDDFYTEIFKKEWHSIRYALLTKNKYVALINNYSDSMETKSELEKIGAINMRVLFNLENEYIKKELKQNKRIKALENIWKNEDVISTQNTTIDEPETPKFSLEESLKTAEIDSSRIIDSSDSSSASLLYEFVPTTSIKGMDDYVPESQHYQYYDTSHLENQIEREYTLNFPPNLDIYSYEHSNYTPLRSPKMGSTGVLNYYLMDGGSVLPILALDIQPGQRILDMCAAPGGKSLLAIQTLYPNYILCNDVEKSRVDKIYKVFKTYLYDLNEKWFGTNKIQITTQDARYITDDHFDRIIVDVPCTTDRHSLKENDNNIFKSSRIKERLRLPELQSELLVNGLKLLKPGGNLVYSTCTLSPIQNDGVVHMALRRISEETSMKFVIKDLSPALLQSRCLFKLADRSIVKYGHLVLPFGPLNFGPTYFCKIQKLS